MEAGRELDLAIAEGVMGWRWVDGDHYDVTGLATTPTWLLPPDMSVADVGPGEWTYYEEHEDDEWVPGPGPRFPPPRTDNRLTIFDVPRYSTEIAAAWKVVECLRAQSVNVEIRAYGGIGETAIEVDIRTLKEGRQLAAGSAETAPFALCMAALDWLGRVGPGPTGAEGT